LNEAPAEQEFKKYEIDIVNVVGLEAYQRILWEYQCVITEKISLKTDEQEAVSIFLQDVVKLSLFVLAFMLMFKYILRLT
jgi:hypothetical protein